MFGISRSDLKGVSVACPPGGMEIMEKMTRQEGAPRNLSGLKTSFHVAKSGKKKLPFFATWNQNGNRLTTQSSPTKDNFLVRRKSKKSKLHSEPSLSRLCHELKNITTI